MLAQEWLYGSRVPSRYDNYVERALELPTEFNPHSSLVVLNRLAERIVFTDDVPSMLYELYENKQLTYEGMIASARLPYDCFWLEYSTTIDQWHKGPDDITTIGALIQRIGTDKVRMFIIVGLKLKRHPDFHSTLAYVVEFDEWPPITASVKRSSDGYALKFSVVYAFNQKKLFADGNKQREEQLGEIGAMVSEVIFGIFLVTQPKVYSVEEVKYKDSHKRARAAKRKHPLMEYKRIRVHIGRKSKHYARATASHVDTESAAAVQHRRYHKVMGHFRHYINHEPPHTTWIEPHYRGDPALGVTFIERDVSR